jgi:glutathione synthase/RimK-type ligase-like ATP-grasp enzyme
MSSAKWTIVNGVKYVNEDVKPEIEQTEEDVKMTTSTTIYFQNYIVEKKDGEVVIKKRHIS